MAPNATGATDKNKNMTMKYLIISTSFRHMILGQRFNQILKLMQPVAHVELSIFYFLSRASLLHFCQIHFIPKPRWPSKNWEYALNAAFGLSFSFLITFH
jgi:hypothetical protein